MDLTFGFTTIFENIEGYPSQTNDTGLVELIKLCAEDVLGPAGVHIGRPHMGAEDFSYFCQKWPGAMIGLGCHDSAKGFQFSLHSPHFDMDESVLDVGVRLFGHALVRYLEKGSADV